jgi:hypothetical protein
MPYFQDFSNFIRAQTNVRSVEWDVFYDECQNRDRNYIELCKHLFKQKTLKSFSLDSIYISDLFRSLETPVPSLDHLELFYSVRDVLDCSQILRLFPNISYLLLDTVSRKDFDLRPLNSLERLTTLKLYPVPDKMFEQLDLKGLSRINMGWIQNLDIIEWENFIRRHTELRHLEIGRFTIEHLQIILANLPQLEVLSGGYLVELTDDNEKQAIETIGKLYQKLEKFEIVTSFKNPEVIANFKIAFPGIPIGKTEYGRVVVGKPIADPEDRRLWSRKNMKSFYKSLE